MNEWKKETRVAKDFVSRLRTPACDEGRGFALHCALKHSSTANLEKRVVKFSCCYGTRTWRDVEVPETRKYHGGVRLLGARLFALFAQQLPSTSFSWFSSFLGRVHLIFLSLWGEFCVDLTYLSCAVFQTAVLWWSCDGQYVVSDERNVSFAAAIGFKMKILPFVAYEVSFT